MGCNSGSGDSIHHIHGLQKQRKKVLKMYTLSLTLSHVQTWRSSSLFKYILITASRIMPQEVSRKGTHKPMIYKNAAIYINIP